MFMNFPDKNKKYQSNLPFTQPSQDCHGTGRNINRVLLVAGYKCQISEFFKVVAFNKNIVAAK
jgi:hypothetical protein